MLVSVTTASPNISTIGDLSQLILLKRLSIPENIVFKTSSSFLAPLIIKYKTDTEHTRISLYFGSNLILDRILIKTYTFILLWWLTEDYNFLQNYLRNIAVESAYTILCSLQNTQTSH